MLLDAFHAVSAEEPEADEQPSIEQIAAKEAVARLVFKTFMTRGLLGFDATPSASEGIRQLKIHAAARRSRYYPGPGGVTPAFRMEVQRDGLALQEERGRMGSDADFDMQAQMLVRHVPFLQSKLEDIGSGSSCRFSAQLDPAGQVASPRLAESLDRAPTLVLDHPAEPERQANTPRIRSLASWTTSTRTPASVQKTTERQSAKALGPNATLDFPRSKVRPTFATLSKAVSLFHSHHVHPHAQTSHCCFPLPSHRAPRH